MSAPNRIPGSTYRLQLNAGFPFESALAQLDYLDRLGIDSLYLSPVMRAREGSSHGYDVVDPTDVNPVLGGEEGLRRLSKAARNLGIGILLDIVPNHMAATTENPTWETMLRDGPEAQEADVFDIFWEPDGKVILPILGDHYADVLERGEIIVVEQSGNPTLVYYKHNLPVSRDAASREALQRYVELQDDEGGVEALDALIACQHYRLSYWRTGSRAVNYRRFFDINDLAAVRAENGVAFDLVHRAIRPLVNDGIVTGLRIDHVDGLRDPKAYLEQLQHYLGRPAGNPLYVVVEKILSGDETLPDTWPIAGTTGYDFLNMSSGALSSTAGLADLIAMTGRYAAAEADFDALLYRAKHQVIEELFAADLSRLTDRLARIARDDRYGRDLIREELDAAIREITVCLPVYRTYISTDATREEDERLIEKAASDALDRRPDLQTAIRFVSRVLLLQDAGQLSEQESERRLDVTAAWQQFTGPVMAKGLEDTTLYRDPTLLSANAVGGEREIAAVSVADFHSWMARRSADWPHAMNATSTHDSKRSEDVRARIAVLSEIPDEWEKTFEELREASASDVRSVDGLPVPDGRAVLMLFQTLLGSWPLGGLDSEEYPARVKSYAIKAEREAKLRTTWIDQNQVYEEALQSFINDLLENDRFLDLFAPFQDQIAFYGMLNSLAASLMKMTVPGIPDFYQGSEIWDFSLVDPDNRRPVDYDLRRSLLDRLESGVSAAELREDWKSGAIKLAVIRQTLHDRRQHPAIYREGRYVPLDTNGGRAGNIIAFARVLDQEWRVTVAPRLTARLDRESGREIGTFPLGVDAWGDTSITLPANAPTSWKQILPGDDLAAPGSAIPVAAVLARFPVALLSGVS